MNLGILKIMGIMFFIPGFGVTILIGDCLKTRSLAEVRSYPLVTAIALLIELLAIWGLAHLMKTYKKQKPFTIDELPAHVMDTNPRQRSNDRLVFLISAAMHFLGLVCGFWLAWTRYRP